MRKGFVTAALAMLVSSAGASVVAKTAPATHANAAHAAAARPATVASDGVMVDRAIALKSGVNADVLDRALTAVSCGVASGDLQAPPTLTLIDYSLPSTAPRLWVFDLHTGNMLFNELVAHGRNSGDNMATRFSDAMESRESSIGLFRTADTYVGHNGYSLRLDGLEPGFNSHARDRAIGMHCAARGRVATGHRHGSRRRRDLLVLPGSGVAQVVAISELPGPEGPGLHGPAYGSDELIESRSAASRSR